MFFFGLFFCLFFFSFFLSFFLSLLSVATHLSLSSPPPHAPAPAPPLHFIKYSLSVSFCFSVSVCLSVCLSVSWKTESTHGFHAMHSFVQTARFSVTNLLWFCYAQSAVSLPCTRVLNRPSIKSVFFIPRPPPSPPHTHFAP